MRFTYCVNMGFNLIILKMSPDWFVWQYMEDWSLRRRFCSRKRCTHYDDNADAILFGENHCKKNSLLSFKQCLRWTYGFNQTKYTRITITHDCLTAITLAGSLSRCLNAQFNGLVFKQLPRHSVDIDTWKNMCNPYMYNYIS